MENDHIGFDYKWSGGWTRDFLFYLSVDCLLYTSKLFHGTVVPKDRSLMNVPFVTGDKEMDAKFVAEAAKAGLVNLKGHRTVGGMRARCV